MADDAFVPSISTGPSNRTYGCGGITCTLPRQHAQGGGVTFLPGGILRSKHRRIACGRGPKPARCHYGSCRASHQQIPSLHKSPASYDTATLFRNLCDNCVLQMLIFDFPLSATCDTFILSLGPIRLCKEPHEDFAARSSLRPRSSCIRCPRGLCDRSHNARRPLRLGVRHGRLATRQGLRTHYRHRRRSNLAT